MSAWMDEPQEQELQPVRRDLVKQETKASPKAMTFVVSCQHI